MALKVLITAIDTTNTAKSFGIVGSVLLNESDIKNANRAVANDNAVPDQKPELNSKKLIAAIDQLSIMDNLFKQKLNNQKVAYQNSKLNAQEDRIERQDRLEQTKDAERVQSSSGSGLGMLGLLGLGLLAYDPVMKFVTGMVDFTLETATFISNTVTQIKDFFTGFFPDDVPEETPTETPKVDAPTAPPVTTPPADANPVVPPATTTPPANATPVTPPAAGESKPAPAEESAKPKPVVKDNRSWWERNAPSFAGGKPAPAQTATPANSSEKEKASAAGQVIEVNHPDTGSGWGVSGGKDSNGRPVVFSKEAAMAFAQMMKDSGGLVKPSDVTSSKRTVAYQEDMKRRGYKPAANSLHLRGIALDIHGSSQGWIKKHGHKYGWQLNDYSGSHGGHFDYKGPGAALPAEQGAGTNNQQSIVDQVTAQATKTVDKTLTNMAEFIGTVGGKVVGPGMARSLTTAAPNFAQLISNEAATQTAEIAKIKDAASKPTPSPVISPPNISAAGSSTVENLPTMVDRNSVQYYLNRFGYKETNTPMKAA